MSQKTANAALSLALTILEVAMLFVVNFLAQNCSESWQGDVIIIAIASVLLWHISYNHRKWTNKDGHCSEHNI